MAPIKNKKYSIVFFFNLKTNFVNVDNSRRNTGAKNSIGRKTAGRTFFRLIGRSSSSLDVIGRSLVPDLGLVPDAAEVVFAGGRCRVAWRLGLAWRRVAWQRRRLPGWEAAWRRGFWRGAADVPRGMTSVAIDFCWFLWKNLSWKSSSTKLVKSFIVQKIFWKK